MLTLADFYIGFEFYTETGRWRCTDVGSRTVIAISLEPHEIVTLHEDGNQTTEMQNGEDLYYGPPYMIVEHVFNEYDMEGLYAHLDDIPQ